MLFLLLLVLGVRILAPSNGHFINRNARMAILRQDTPLGRNSLAILGELYFERELHGKRPGIRELCDEDLERESKVQTE